MLSVLGTDTQPVWVETAEFLRVHAPAGRGATIDGVGHLLHIQDAEPVARAMTKFLACHPMSGG